jgi:hypothetical protein
MKQIRRDHGISRRLRAYLGGRARGAFSPLCQCQTLAPAFSVPRLIHTVISGPVARWIPNGYDLPCTYQQPNGPAINMSPGVIAVNDFKIIESSTYINITIVHR